MVAPPGFTFYDNTKVLPKIAAEVPSIKLFDDIIVCKRLRGRGRALPSPFHKSPLSTTSFLNDTTDHLWRSAAASLPSSSRFSPQDLRGIAARIPAKLDPAFMKEPRSIAGAARVGQANRTKRKPVASMLPPQQPQAVGSVGS